jgi:hypothetical protein
MMAVNTIEQRIAAVLDQKREMFDMLFADQRDASKNAAGDGPAKSGPLSQAGGLSRDEIFGLFDLRAPGGKKVA